MYKQDPRGKHRPIEIALIGIDRSLLGVDGKTASFDFKWADNPHCIELWAAAISVVAAHYTLYII